MKNNKKFALGSVLALALSVGIIAPNAADAKGEEIAPTAASTETKEDVKAEIATDDQILSAQHELEDYAASKGYDTSDAISGIWDYSDEPVVELNKFVADRKAEIDAAVAGNEETPQEDEDAKVLTESKETAIAELKEAGITSDFFLDQIRKANTIEGVEALKGELLKSHTDSKEDEKPEIDFEDLLKDEDSLKDYLTKLKEDKEEGKLTDEEYKKIGDRFLELLKDKDSSDKFLEALKANQDEFEELFDFSKVNPDGTIKKVNKDDKKVVKNDYVKKHDNVKTGVAGLTGVVGALAAAGAALFASKKRK